MLFAEAHPHGGAICLGLGSTHCTSFKTLQKLLVNQVTSFKLQQIAFMFIYKNITKEC